MKQLSKVLWSEGMFLGPQHFQFQDRYFEDSVHFAISSLWFAPYGVLGFEIDENALRNGTLALLNARGIFPDGIPFHMPDSDTLPPPRNIANLIPPISEGVTFSLGIPARKPDGLNCTLAPKNGSKTRYVAESRPVYDENTGRDEKTAQFARKNIQLLLNTELTNDWVQLPIGRIKRSEAGQLMLDGNFVPPSLQITASPRLMMLQRRLIEILEEKNRTLSQREPGEAYAAAEVTRFWLLHTVNSNLVRLRHLYFSKRGHPEELYLALASLAGALCTFGLDANPLGLPLYDHEHLEECFDELDQQIRIRLEVVIPTNALTIALKPVGESFYLGSINDSRCLASEPWILSIQSPLEKAELIARVPQLVKVCSNEFIAKLVQRAMPGLPLTYLPSPPPAVRYSPNRHYFAVGKIGPCWDHIIQTREVGVYVPEVLSQPTLELTAILPT